MAVVSIAAGASMAAMILLPMRFSWGSAWVVPWNVVPGARAIRAIGRVMLAGVPLAMIAIGAGRASVREQLDAPVARLRWFRPVALACAAVVLLEQLNISNPEQVFRQAELDILEAVPPPPQDCRSFFVVDSLPNNIWYAEIGAMPISQHIDLPTLNGYSGFAPAQFGTSDIYAPEYRDLMIAWAIAKSATDGLCRYDLTTHEWAIG